MSIALTPLGFTSTGLFDAAASEIVAHDAANPNLLFVSNSAANTVSILDISDPNAPAVSSTISLAPYGDNVNSVAVHDGVVAIAVQNATVTNPGKVVFFDTDGNYLGEANVGALPDMVTFTADGTRVLVANEGEPSGGVNPVGSVSIIDISGGPGSATVITAGFAAFNGQETALRAEGVRIADGVSAAQDFEPEYITVLGDRAYVTLQENNAIAVLDLDTGSATYGAFIDIIGLSLKDYAANGGLDASDQAADGIDIQPFPVFGYYQPDGIAAYEADGQVYLVTANEGDVRNGEQNRVSAGAINLDNDLFPNEATLKTVLELGRLNVFNAADFAADPDRDGDIDRIVAAGGRSFSIWDTQGNLMFDSGNDFERITALLLPDNFNASHNSNTAETRSDDKGPEPEGVVVGEIDGHTYAFVGLERIGGIMVYDVGDPADAEFVQYINTRNFAQTPGANSGGDLGPEGLAFIAATESPTGSAMLAVGHEVSGTTRLFEINIVTVPSIVQYGTTADDSFLGDTASDSFFGAAGNDVADGWSGADLLDGGSGEDSLLGDSGDDSLFGGSGNDLLSGDTGQDLAFGGAGHDIVLAGNGNDRVDGDSGNDWLEGQAGHDSLEGGNGSDGLFGGSGNDTVFGGNDHDLLWGGEGDDELQGGNGEDLCEGGSGQDRLFGGNGNDRLFGGDGDDVIYLGRGADTYSDGNGNDTVFAGDGAADRLVFGASVAGNDTIASFDDGQDRLDLSSLYGPGLGPSDYDDFLADGGSITDLRPSSAVAGVVDVVLPGGRVVHILVDAGENIGQADFIFA